MTSILQVWDSVWIGAFASAILYGCYRVVEWRWPEKYLGMHETFGLSTQETWIRFLAYRALPTFLISASCFVTVDRLGGPIWLSAVVIWSLSIAATHGRIALAAFRSRSGEVNYAGYHIQMILILSLVVASGLLCVPAWAPLVPTPEELVAAAWSGLLLAALGALLAISLKERPQGAPYYGSQYFIERAVRDVGLEALDWLFLESIRTGADPVLLKSILVVEVVQRPRWFRRLEALGARLGLKITTGAMQMSSSSPLTDRQSITRAAEAYSGHWSLRYEDQGGFSMWRADLGEMWPVSTRHNGDASFAEKVEQVANTILNDSELFHFVDNPNSGILLELRRLPQEFALRGVSQSESLRVIEFDSVGGKSQREVSIPGASSGRWRAWQTAISPSARRVAIIDMPSGVGSILALERGKVASAEQFKIKLESDSTVVVDRTERESPPNTSSQLHRRRGVARTSTGKALRWSPSSGSGRART